MDSRVVELSYEGGISFSCAIFFTFSLMGTAAKIPAGSPCVDLSAARIEALESGRHVIADWVRQGRRISPHCLVEIADADQASSADSLSAVTISGAPLSASALTPDWASAALASSRRPRSASRGAKFRWPTPGTPQGRA